MLRLLLPGAAFLAAMGVALVTYRAALVFWKQYRDFHPSPERIGDPRSAPAGVSYRLRDGTEVKGWTFASANGAAVVFVHGSPGDRRSLLPLAESLRRSGYGSVLIDVPGHGESSGAATWDGNALEAVQQALALARRQPGVRHAALVGYSMGSNIAARVAVREPGVQALVLLAPFTDLAAQLRYQFRYRLSFVSEAAVLAARFSGVPVDEMRTLDAVRSLGGRPLMIVAGDADGAIPVSMPRALFAAAQERKLLWIVERAGHADVRDVAGPDEFDDRIRAFLDEALLK